MIKTRIPAIRLMKATMILALFSSNSYSQTKDPDKEIGATGKVTFTYLGKEVNYTTVRAKDGNIWLQQNLGSKRVALSYDDKQSYGDLFQWGRWDDGHQQREPVFSSRKTVQPNDPTGLDLNGQNPFLYEGWQKSWWVHGKETDTWSAPRPQDATATNGCDPCKALGADWRLPTQSEWISVITAEDITDASSGMRSNLKISLAGNREEKSTVIGTDGYYGIFWTPDTYESGIAFVVAFMREGVMATDKTMYRGAALSIRCIKAKALSTQ